MKIEVNHEADCALFVVSESVDALTAPELAKAITDEIARGHVNLVVDLTGVDFMSSAGLRILLGALKESRSHGGDLRITSTNPGVDKILKMSGFHNIAKVFPSQIEALSSFRS